MLLLLLGILLSALQVNLYAEDKTEAEIIHWWYSGADAQAIAYLSEIYNNSGGLWYSSAKETYSVAREEVVSRLARGYPPTAMQWHAGFEASQMKKLGYLNSINDLNNQSDWENLYLKPVLDIAKVDDDYSGLPLSLHIESWLWVNKELFKKFNLPLPKTWNDVLHASKVFQENNITPIIASNESWQIQVIFKNIYLSIAGKELYKDTYQALDPAVTESEKFKEAIKIFKNIKKVSRQSQYGPTWQDQAKSLADGNAAMFFMGDWAKGELMHLGMSLEENLSCILTLNSSSDLIYVVDMFVFGKSALKEDIDNQKKLVNEFQDPKIMQKFANLKGAISPFINVDINELDRCSQKASILLRQEGSALPSIGNYGDGFYVSRFDKAATDIWLADEQGIDHAIEVFSNAIKANKPK